MRQPQTSVITLKELSHVSGYSISTVSKALNNKQDISEETRQLIKRIAKKYNYVPNNFAVALRKKRTKVISVILPQVNTHFSSYFLYNIQKVAYSFGYRIILFQSFEEESKEKEFIDASNDGSVDGIIVLSRNEFLTKYYRKETLPIEYVQIEKDISIDQLKKDCISRFSKLLGRLS
ncbi:LacI family DNA-binding transcriptional regulator [uncultured Psychroserpens sp.]|uniref:LacI family DNA-binding transcriptional regulator n=1 Tax=uncultured Psychroserpens sp. TaxID=255436 RepID=UPI002605C89F|nr:LacI family DNA-binding transcriptional regulator [uncultured Psychroserpens sp.]